MNNLKFIISVGIVSLLVLSVTLGWSGYTFYKLEKKKISEQIADMVKETATTVQNENLTMNNQAASYTDKDGAQKQAFAIGMTGNSGKMQLYFYDEQDEDISDSNIPVFTRDTLEQLNIKYLPQAVRHIQYFDTLFRDTLHIAQLVLPYYVARERDGSNTFSFMSDSTAEQYEYHSQPFIINYYEPEVFRVNYNVPFIMVVKSMGAFIAVCMLLFALVVLAFITYYRTYKMQLQMSAFKESLFSNITHELKTPLSSLQLIIDSAKKNNDISEDHLSFASGELNRMKLIIDKILAYGKMSKEQFALNTEIVDIDTIISEAIDAISVMLANSNGSIIYDNRQKINIMGDKALLVNMFTSLFDNAIKYNKNTPEIIITTTKNDADIIITVSDNGIGIPVEYRKKVFEPFFRVPTGNIHEVKGHGIGLSFVSQIVKLHSGTITIPGKKDHGSIFTITLPL